MLVNPRPQTTDLHPSLSDDVTPILLQLYHPALSGDITSILLQLYHPALSGDVTSIFFQLYHPALSGDVTSILLQLYHPALSDDVTSIHLQFYLKPHFFLQIHFSGITEFRSFSLCPCGSNSSQNSIFQIHSIDYLLCRPRRNTEERGRSCKGKTDRSILS